jgi:hypothetical protein
MNNIKRVVNLVRTLITNILNLKQLIQTNEKPKGISKLIYKELKEGQRVSVKTNEIRHTP